jgi:two-component system, OmpR family, phosphate regulon sensor histidine kinase PhoR
LDTGLLLMNPMTDEVAHGSESMRSPSNDPLLAGVTLGLVVAALGLAASSINATAGLITGAGAAGLGGLLIARRNLNLLDHARQETLVKLQRLIPTHRANPEPDHADTQSEELDLEGAVSELGEHIDLLGQVIEAFDSAVIGIDDQGHIEFANPAAGLLLVNDPGELIGQNLKSLFTEAAVHALCERARQDGSASDRIRIVGENAVGTYESVALTISVSRGLRVVLMLRDVTELAQASALKTDFVGNASHELRTPIAAIRGAVETLLGSARDDEHMRVRLAEMIYEHAIRLEELVGDLLDLSRLETPDRAEAFDRVDLFTVCQEIKASLDLKLTSRKIELDLELDSQLHDIWTSPRAVRLVVRNLLDNAVKFSHEGGRVRLVGTVLASPPESVRLEVIDQGVGIPLAHQTRIFERFFQVDDARSGSHPLRGTGLGLSIVKHALRRIGGDIEVESVWNEGTTMTVVFPVRAPTTAPEE